MKSLEKSNLSFRKENFPSWVMLNQINNILTSEDNNRVLYVDRQINLIDKSTFLNIISQIRNGVDMQNDATISIDFDENYQNIFMHTLRIYRAGQIIDKIDSCKVQQVQQEKNYDRHVYDGSQTLFFFLDDIREGDKIEYAYTISGFNPIRSSCYDSIYRFSYGEPITYQTLRVIKSKDQPLFIKDFETNINYSVNQLSDNLEDWIWIGENIKNFSSESYQSPSYMEPGFVQISTFKTWHDLAKWTAQLYILPDHFSPEMENFISQWEGLPLKEQILNVIRFVQDNVRYLGFEDGINGFKPQPPETVFNRRFGDCKDKTHLLQGLLSLLGIESCPVLVHSHLGPTLKNFLPGISVFNHVILKFEFEGTTYWIDPTVSFQGGDLDDCCCPNYYYGLVLNNEVYDLAPIPLKNSGETKICTVFDVRDEKSISMQVVTTYLGVDADYFRWKNISKTIEEHQTCFVNFYNSLQLPVKPTKTPTIEDNRMLNQIIVKEFYGVDNFWIINPEAAQKSFRLELFTLPHYLNLHAEAERRTPIYHPFPLKLHEEVHILKTDLWSGRDVFDEIEGDAFKFNLSRLIDENIFTVSYVFESLKPEVHPQQANEHKMLMHEVLNNLSWIIHDEIHPTKQKTIFSMLADFFRRFFTKVKVDSVQCGKNV